MELRGRIDRVLEGRLAQAAEKDFKRHMGRLQRMERQFRRKKQGGKPPMTFSEKQALRAQQHGRFAEMSEAEKDALNAERDAMWAQIPVHLQDKAKKLAGR